MARLDPEDDKRYFRDYYPNNKDAIRNNFLRRTYGITLDDYRRIFDSQGGACALCGEVPGSLGASTKRQLCVDHDHETGTVRGLLCIRCNMSLGILGDTPTAIRGVLNYLEGGGSGAGEHVQHAEGN